MKSEFERILREKLAKNKPQGSESPWSRPLETPPDHLAFLLATIGKTSIYSGKNKVYFPPSSTRTDIQRLSQIELPTPPKPPNHLTNKQKEGWLWFWKKGAALNENFNKTELQKQFRRLARSLHPDQNPHPRATETYIQLREHYDQLSLV